MSEPKQSPKIHRPTPRRPYDHRSAPPQPSSPFLSPSLPDETPSRTHSILDLTSSTLLGIYSPTGYDRNDGYGDQGTPWGTGAQTPYDDSEPLTLTRTTSIPQQPILSPSLKLFSFAWRSTLLFGIGMGYGGLVRHLHDARKVAAFQVEGIMRPRSDWTYLILWGIAGVALGSLLPWVDTLFHTKTTTEPAADLLRRRRSPSPRITTEDESRTPTGILGADWTPAIRSVGAFAGIAFAIRKLPWTSSLQASLTLFLVNPVLWYLLDRSKPGFVLSSAIGATGTALLLASNPDMMPKPGTYSQTSNNSLYHSDVNVMGVGIGDYISRESIEGGIWILSVLFCSCVCFGNIGRRLALSGNGLHGSRR